MGLFDSNSYSQDAHYISLEEIRRIVTPIHSTSLTAEEAKTIEDAIIQAQHYNGGKISLHKIYELLNNLFNEHKLSSKVDRDSVMRVFAEYFAEHF